MHSWILASHNRGKRAELSAALSGLGVYLHSQADFYIAPAAETGLSFIENALIKARHAAAHSGLPALADDSGLVVDALQGAPGLYSARYAGISGADADAANNAKLLDQLAQVAPNKRQARFYCALAWVRHSRDPAPRVVQACWPGEILTQAQGEQGFGYDPLFWLPNLGCSAAQLSLADKNRLSHRGQALAQLLVQLRDR